MCKINLSIHPWLILLDIWFQILNLSTQYFKLNGYILKKLKHKILKGLTFNTPI